MDRLSQPAQRGRPVSSVDAARANDVLEHLINAGTLKTILGNYRNMCELLHLKPNVFPLFYPKLKSNLNSWKAKALWKKFDARASHKCYARGKVCPNTRVLIIGAGPCGLRTAIEAQLLGAKVVVIEKRDRMSRNNVLHLWPFVIEDLRALGAKKFFGKFCAGAIDHISIRQLQCILLKVALLLGVEIHTEVSFERLVEPNSTEKTGWRAEFKPSDHPVSQYEFDVIIGADGKRNTLQGFKRKEFRGKLAIAITANFINKRTEAEARVEEISGVAFIFNQKFFKELNAETGIDLENIVYYKDDTHYFVMTAKKPSLIEKGVIKQDYADTARLLSPDNVDRDALLNYAREAADFSTNYQMPDLEFAVNHYGQPDVAMFDFTSMYAAENASKVVERHGYKLLMILVGDSLLEPFWPTGSGCARGFLSSLDACWAIKAWGSGLTTPLEVLAERESIYRLLAQTTPENLNKDCKAYTVDPSTRYPNLNKAALLPQQVLTLYDTDDPSGIELTSRTIQQPATTSETHRKRRRRDMHLDPNTLINWIKEQIREHEDLIVEDLTTSFKDGRVLCAILHHYRPDLLDYSAIKAEDVAKNNQLAFDLLEKEIGISPVMTGEDMAKAEIPDYLTMFSYLTQIYDTFRGEIPHIKHPKLDLPHLPELKEAVKVVPSVSVRTNDTTVGVVTTSRSSSRTKRHAEPFSATKLSSSTERKNKKRRSFEKYDFGVEERRKRLEEIAENRSDRQNKRRQQRQKQTEQFIKSMQMLQTNAKPDTPEPFEDYSLFVYRQTAPHFQDRVKDLEKKFTYVPDPENRLPVQSRVAGADEELAARIKDFEDKWRDPMPVDKKPKDLMRAIGKIQTSDWNIKEIEKKIIENKLGKSVNKEKERVPKWNREQFLARQTRLEKLDRQSSAEAKFSEVDKSIKHLEQRLKEGSVRDLGQNKVATITEKLAAKQVEPEVKSTTKPTIPLPTQGGSEYCHFCQKRVYLMERLSAEGRFFHRGCFKCQYCQTTLRLGSYMFDRDGQYDHRFFCTQHFGMPGELYPSKTETKITPKKESAKPSLEKLKIISLGGVEGVDLLDRVQTPERIEFANLSAGHISSDHEESFSQMDEDEWTDRNFGASTAEICSSDEDEDSSSLSGSESDNEDAYEEALEEPPTKEGTMRWMERYNQRYSKERRRRDDSDSEDYSSSSDHSSYYENSSGDEEDEPPTEGEEEIRARELRKQEVRVEPPVVQTDTGSDTEVKIPSSLPTDPIQPALAHNGDGQESCPLDLPDILIPHDSKNLRECLSNENKNLLSSNLNESSSNISVTSADYNTADSGEFDNLNRELMSAVHFQSKMSNSANNSDNSKCDSSANPSSSEDNSNSSIILKQIVKLSALSKSATVASLGPQSVKRNFILPPREKRASFGKEFIPQFKLPEPEPLLVIKRTPSKINLPNEPGKPKVVVKTNIDNAKKYFGESRKPKVPKPTLLRSETLKATPTVVNVKNNVKEEPPAPPDRRVSFSFEPKEEDLKDIDDYIENLLANEDELMKPIDPDKFSIKHKAPSDEEINKEDEKLSSSIEDLLKALEVETKNTGEVQTVPVKFDDKINDLLDWMDDLDHQLIQKNKVYRSFSDVKYKKLENALKMPQHAEAVVNKIPKNNITFFEQHLAGKPINLDDSLDVKQGNYKLDRSKTDVHFNRKPRSSVDLDAVSKVDVKKVLQKFESGSGFENNNEEKTSKPPLPKMLKRQSLGNFDFRKFEAPPKAVAKSFFYGDLRAKKGKSESSHDLTSVQLVKNLDEEFRKKSYELLLNNHEPNLENRNSTLMKVQSNIEQERKGDVNLAVNSEQIAVRNVENDKIDNSTLNHTQLTDSKKNDDIDMVTESETLKYEEGIKEIVTEEIQKNDLDSYSESESESVELEDENVKLAEPENFSSLQSTEHNIDLEEVQEQQCSENSKEPESFSDIKLLPVPEVLVTEVKSEVGITVPAFNLTEKVDVINGETLNLLANELSVLKPDPEVPKIVKLDNQPPIRPQRAVRQRSLEHKVNNTPIPQAPPRKQSLESLPMKRQEEHDKENIFEVKPIAPPRHKFTGALSRVNTAAAKQHQQKPETSNEPTEVEKAKVTTYMLPRPQKPILNRSMSDQNVSDDFLLLPNIPSAAHSTSHLQNTGGKSQNKNKNDCKIQ